MLSPVLEAAVESSQTKFEKEFDLMTVDTDQEGELAAQYRVSLLPLFSRTSNPPVLITRRLNNIEPGHCSSHRHRFQRWEAYFGVSGGHPPIKSRGIH